MSHDLLIQRTNELLNSIDLCFKNTLIAPALILVYSTIDIMAWLNRDANHDDVIRSDFLNWVNQYLLPNSQLGCQAIDLYGARCSLLHSYISESKLSRQGQARELFYSWGNCTANELQNVIDADGSRDAVAIQFEDLRSALKDGISNFIVSEQNNPLILQRIVKLFGNYPSLS